MHISGFRPFMQDKHEPIRMKKPHKDKSEADFQAVLDAEMKKMEPAPTKANGSIPTRV